MCSDCYRERRQPDSGPLSESVFAREITSALGGEPFADAGVTPKAADSQIQRCEMAGV